MGGGEPGEDRERVPPRIVQRIPRNAEPWGIWSISSLPVHNPRGYGANCGCCKNDGDSNRCSTSVQFSVCGGDADVARRSMKKWLLLGHEMVDATSTTARSDHMKLRPMAFAQKWTEQDEAEMDTIAGMLFLERE